MIFYSARFKWTMGSYADGEAFYIQIGIWRRAELREFLWTCEHVGLRLVFHEGGQWTKRSFVVRGQRDDVLLVAEAISRWSKGEPLILKTGNEECK